MCDNNDDDDDNGCVCIPIRALSRTHIYRIPNQIRKKQQQHKTTKIKMILRNCRGTDFFFFFIVLVSFGFCSLYLHRHRHRHCRFRFSFHGEQIYTHAHTKLADNDNSAMKKKKNNIIIMMMMIPKMKRKIEEVINSQLSHIHNMRVMCKYLSVPRIGALRDVCVFATVIKSRTKYKK